jgi:hypothetical protein
MPGSKSDSERPGADRLWRDFPEAPSDLVEARALQRRSDTKFVLPEAMLPYLVAALSGQYAALAPPDLYRTLYFDTLELDLFHDHRRGRRVRHKVRLRSHPKRDKHFLEIKTRRSGLLTVKFRQPRLSGDPTLTRADREFIAAHTGLTRPVAAQVGNEYRRMTLVGLRANERVTVDRCLRYGMPDFPGPGAPIRSFEGLAIVEVKQWPFSRRTPVMSALKSLGLRPGWASKYCIGILSTHMGLRGNRLLPGMRALEALIP